MPSASLFRRVANACTDVSAKALRHFHAYATVAWAIAGIAFAYAPKSLKESVTAVILISIYANFVGHFSSWQAARAEEQAQSDA